MNRAVIADDIDSLPVGAWPDGPIGGLALTLVLSGLSGIASAVLGLVLGTGLAISGGPVRRALALGLGFFRALPIVMLIFRSDFRLPILFGVSAPKNGTVVAALSLVGGAYRSQRGGGGDREHRARPVGGGSRAGLLPLAGAARRRAATGAEGHGPILRQPVVRADRGHVARLRHRGPRAVRRDRSARPLHGRSRDALIPTPAGVRDRPDAGRILRGCPRRRAGSGQGRAVTVYGRLKRTVELS